MELAVLMLSAAVAGMLAGFGAHWLAGRRHDSEIRRIDADIDDLFERLEAAQKRAAARARRAESPEDESPPQGSLPGVADPKLKARIRAAWLSRKTV